MFRLSDSNSIKEFLGEVLGTFIMVLLGDGVVANVGLAPRLSASAYNWIAISMGWGFAVIIAVYISGGVSGAHLNPAVTLALAFKRSFPWFKVPIYIIAQFVGAFLGALGVYLVYMEGLQSANMPNVWSTGPGSVFGRTFWGGGESIASMGNYSLINASIAEFISTMILMWGILASNDLKNMGLSGNLGVLIVGFTVLAVILSLGGPSGASLNPARDLAPRFFGAMVGTKGLFDGIYWLVPPVIIPSIAGPIGMWLYDILITSNLPEKK